MAPNELIKYIAGWEQKYRNGVENVQYFKSKVQSQRCRDKGLNPRKKQFGDIYDENPVQIWKMEWMSHILKQILFWEHICVNSLHWGTFSGEGLYQFHGWQMLGALAASLVITMGGGQAQKLGLISYNTIQSWGPRQWAWPHNQPIETKFNSNKPNSALGSHWSWKKD